MARSVRPRTLAIAFGIYFLVIAYFAWTFGKDQTDIWYPADITRWIYTTYMIVSAIFLVGLGGLSANEVAARRARISARQKFLGRFVTGPGLAAATVLGISGIMLLGAEGFDQTNFQLNTQLILGIGYSWLGIGAYIATTIAALV